VASEAECLLRLAEDGTVSVDHLEGLVPRVIELERTTDSFRDERLRATLFDDSTILFDQRTALRDFEKGDSSQQQNSIRLIQSLSTRGTCERFVLLENTVS
jgi:hypothetical protein